MADISGLGFDAQAVEPNEGFELLPAGDYEAVIVGSEIKPTSNQQGKYIALELQVINGKFQNRKLWDNLNIWNQSEKAVTIAKGTLSAICRAVNVPTPRDTADLHNKPLRVTVAIEQSVGFNPKNVIKSYKPRQAGPATPAQPAMTAASTTNEAPWG